MRTLLAAITLGLGLSAGAAGAAPGKLPQVNRIVIDKSDHKLWLFEDDKELAAYDVSIGPGGPGYKRQEGDRVTPVGSYRVIAHQVSKSFKIFLRLDYPNAEDHARFKALKASGELPKTATIGGDIGIHGQPQHFNAEQKASLIGEDWTLGCISVTDSEITDIARSVKNGTVVEIRD